MRPLAVVLLLAACTDSPTMTKQLPADMSGGDPVFSTVIPDPDYGTTQDASTAPDLTDGTARPDLATADLVAAPDEARPDLTAPPAPDLWTPPPDLTPTGDLWTCGAVRSNCKTGADCCAGTICGFPPTGIQPQTICCMRGATPCISDDDCCFDDSASRRARCVYNGNTNRFNCQ